MVYLLLNLFFYTSHKIFHTVWFYNYCFFIMNSCCRFLGNISFLSVYNITLILKLAISLNFNNFNLLKIGLVCSFHLHLLTVWITFSATLQFCLCKCLLLFPMLCNNPSYMVRLNYHVKLTVTNFLKDVLLSLEYPYSLQLFT